MRENTAASVQEFVWQWERQARMTKPNEVERAITAWREERPTRRMMRWREAMAKALVALALRLDRTMTTSALVERTAVTTVP